MYTLLIIIHVLISIVLCVVVLLQSSKGGGLAGAFGGGGGAPQQILGSRGMTTLLHKITIYCAVGFFLTSFTLFLMTGSRNELRAGASVVQQAAQDGTLTSDVTPMEPIDVNALPVEATDSAGDDATETGGGDDDQ